MDKLDHFLENEIGLEFFKSGFERVYETFKIFKKDFSKKTIVTIGGTNGKGETSFS